MAGDSPEQLEQLVLRVMCLGTPEGSIRAEAAGRLADYRWREAVHQAIFACLVSIPSVEGEELRRALLTCLTRKGFPDVDLEFLFQPQMVSGPVALQLIQGLAQSN